MSFMKLGANSASAAVRRVFPRIARLAAVGALALTAPFAQAQSVTGLYPAPAPAAANGYNPTSAYGALSGYGAMSGYGAPSDGTTAGGAMNDGTVILPTSSGSASTFGGASNAASGSAANGTSATASDASGQASFDTSQFAPSNGRMAGQQGAGLANMLNQQSEQTSLLKQEPSEFEKFVEASLGKPLPRFGASLLMNPERPSFIPNTTIAIPPDYTLNVGDELIVNTTGSIDTNLHLVINNDGTVFIPQVGAVSLAGVRYGDLGSVLTERIGRQFRNFKLSVSIARLRGIRVYVTGFAARPGAYTVSSLSTLVDALMSSGGPSSAGSFRSIQLLRHGQVVTNFDLYDLLLKGDKTHDVVLQNEDIIYIGAVGPQVAITGSVKDAAIYESKPGETLGDLLHFAGGPSVMADDTRAYVLRLSNLDKTGWQELDLSAAKAAGARGGDIVRLTSVGDIARPLEHQGVLVKIEGEVEHPGRYYLAPGSTVADLMARAGGLTPRAFVYGTELDRVSIRTQQKQAVDDAIHDFELMIAALPLTSPRGSTVANLDQAQVNAVVERLKDREPDGRMVLPMTPSSQELPKDLALENNDRIYIPPRSTVVGVFGAVFQAGSFYMKPHGTIGDYLKMAGGARKMADRSQIFVVRANGSVLSEEHGLFGHGIMSDPALPGDVIFVPVKSDNYPLVQRLEDVGTILYQFGLGAAAIKVLSQ